MSYESATQTSATRPPNHWVADQFAQLETRLVRYVQRQGRFEVDEARDVVQDAFAKLCQQPWPDIEGHAVAWLYKTCRNQAVDLARREVRMNSLFSKTDVTHLSDQAARQPDEAAVRDEQIDLVRTQLGALPDRQQEILRLRLHDGLSYRQIAEVTGLTVSNVGFLIHQSVSKLRVQLRAES